MTLRLSIAGLLLTLFTACGTTRGVHLDPVRGESFIHLTRTNDAEPVDLREAEFTTALAKQVQRRRLPADPEKAARALFDVPSRSGWYGFTSRQGVAPLDAQPPASQWADASVRVTQQYLRFCEAIGKPGDCRQVLLDNPVLTEEGRYALAMSFALDEVLPEMREAFKDMADPEAVRASILWTMTIYAAMWMAPEPLFSKGLATVITASFITYIGVDTFWTLILGWRRMVEVADRSTSFAENREAGKAYGKVMGKNAARAFALLLTVAVGQTASSFSAQVPSLPGSARAFAASEARSGIRLTDVARVDSVVVTANAVTIALAPNALAATAQSMRGAASRPVDAEGPEHHIATDKWLDANHSGGPWTPKFQELFDQAGMSLNDPVNRIRIKGHLGPHPREYHEDVYRRLREGMQGCRSLHQCEESLRAGLKDLADELIIEGSRLNKLVTRAE